MSEDCFSPLASLRDLNFFKIRGILNASTLVWFFKENTKHKKEKTRRENKTFRHKIKVEKGCYV
jgi:hypothetical protein